MLISWTQSFQLKRVSSFNSQVISPANHILQHSEKIEESKKCWIGKLPIHDVPDSLIE